MTDVAMYRSFLQMLPNKRYNTNRNAKQQQTKNTQSHKSSYSVTQKNTYKAYNCGNISDPVYDRFNQSVHSILSIKSHNLFFLIYATKVQQFLE
ncbi:hypothetical protein AGMMS49965_10810 [Bacteroidia bacterium]|nr:hypothetical protein AGMMS49965_10810 [Bacteroidia bacterium]